MANDSRQPRNHDARPEGVRHRGNSREYIIERLKREGHAGWVQAIESGRVSAYAVATHLWFTRPPTVAGEDGHRAKRRRFALARVGG